MRNLTLLLTLSIILFSCNNDSCTDGILNQDETSVDCGGVCSPCPSCTDGIMNQDETGVDCGGVCGGCPSVQYPTHGTSGPSFLDQNNTYYPSGSGLFHGLKVYLFNGARACFHVQTTSGDNPITGFQYGWSSAAGPNANDRWWFTEQDSADAEFWLVSPGAAVVNYYENGADTLGTPTFTKNVTW